MKTKSIFASLLLGGFLLGATPLAAQNSLPAPGSGGGFNPAPVQGGPGGPGGPGMMPPGGPGGPGWGSPWQSGPSLGININIGNPAPSNSGYTTVMACGYDAQGVWRVLPLYVNYQWNGVQYQVTVINAWNPWTDMWNRGVDMPAYNTSYYLRGNTYDFYTPLSTGTYYFNL